jgi:hypothetical protein
LIGIIVVVGVVFLEYLLGVAGAVFAGLLDARSVRPILWFSSALSDEARYNDPESSLSTGPILYPWPLV